MSSASTRSFTRAGCARGRRSAASSDSRHHSVQAHQRLILLHHLPLLDQDLIDDATLEMLHGADLRDRNKLAARERELADRGLLLPTAQAGGQPRPDNCMVVAGDTKAPLLLELDRRREPIRRVSWCRRRLLLGSCPSPSARFMTSGRRVS